MSEPTSVPVVYPPRSYLITTDYVETHTYIGTGNDYTASFPRRQSYPAKDGPRQGYRTIGYRRLIARGVQAGSPYARTVQKLTGSERGNVTFVRQHSTPEGILRATHVGFHNPVWLPSSHLGNIPSLGYTADNHALVRFYSALRQEIEHWNSLVFAGELREIVQQVRRPYPGLQTAIENHLSRYERSARSIRFPRRFGRLEKLRRLSQLASSMWLETAFATLPTLSDVASAAEMLARFFEERRRSRVKGYAERTSRDSPSTWTTGTTASGVVYDSVGWYESKVFVRYLAGLDVDVLGPVVSARRLAELSGVNIRNIPVTAYELIPYSWLADYFTTAGACLSSTCVSTAQVKWALRSEKTVSTWHNIDLPSLERTRASIGVAFRALTGSHLGKYSGSLMTTSRSILDSSNLPLPVVESRPLSDILPGQWANVAALLISRASETSRRVRAHHGIRI